MIFLACCLVVAIAALAAQSVIFIRSLERDRDVQARERNQLLQRIQDPVSAVAMYAQEEVDAPLVRHHLDFDDDQDFSNYRSEMEN